MALNVCTHSIWCYCVDPNLLPGEREVFSVWAHVERWFKKIGCVVKTLEDLYLDGHFSIELAQGKAFKPLKCRRPGCSPTV